MQKIAQRILNLSESQTLAMSQRSRDLAARGHDVINLSVGEPDFNTPDFIKKEAVKALEQNYTRYTPVNGYPELRQAIVEKLKRDNQVAYDPSQIVVSTGAKHALANAVMCLVNPGDEVLVPSPYWVSYRELIRLAGGTPVFIPAKLENDFKITPQQLNEAITPKTKLLMFNSPCNPTGTVYEQEEMKALAKVLEKNQHVWILADEIYEHIVFNGSHVSFGSFDSLVERLVIVNGVSKAFAMTGWRIGFLAAPKVVAAACNKLQGQMTSGTNAIAQRAAIPAFQRDPHSIPELEEMKKAFVERRDLLLTLLADMTGVKANVPQGAFYSFPNISWYLGKSDGETKIYNSNDLCLYLLDKAHVAMVPGEAFGDEKCLRISYATSSKRITEAMHRVKKALQKLD